jgi:hypothetical protein
VAAPRLRLISRASDRLRIWPRPDLAILLNTLLRRGVCGRLKP